MSQKANVSITKCLSLCVVQFISSKLASFHAFYVCYVYAQLAPYTTIVSRASISQAASFVSLLVLVVCSYPGRLGLSILQGRRTI